MTARFSDLTIGRVDADFFRPGQVAALTIWAGLNAVAAIAILRAGLGWGGANLSPRLFDLTALMLALFGGIAVRLAWQVVGANSRFRLAAALFGATPLFALLLSAWSQCPGFDAGFVLTLAGTALAVPFMSRPGQLRQALEPGPRSLHNGARAHAKNEAPHRKPPERGVDWLRRVDDATGQVELEGQAGVLFAAGELQQVVHLPFCPPFSGVPQFSSTPEDERVECKIGALYTWGVRIELRRAGPGLTELRTAVKFKAEGAAAAAE